METLPCKHARMHEQYKDPCIVSIAQPCAALLFRCTCNMYVTAAYMELIRFNIYIANFINQRRQLWYGMRGFSIMHATYAHIRVHVRMNTAAQCIHPVSTLSLYLYPSPPLLALSIHPHSIMHTHTHTHTKRHNIYSLEPPRW